MQKRLGDAERSENKVLLPLTFNPLKFPKGDIQRLQRFTQQRLAFVFQCDQLHPLDVAAQGLQVLVAVAVVDQRDFALTPCAGIDSAAMTLRFFSACQRQDVRTQAYSHQLKEGGGVSPPEGLEE